MRRSREQAAKTRRAIVERASELFRARGISAVSVADIMASLGLTVGGFYRHFASKEALVAESIEAASLETTKRLGVRKTRSGSARGSSALEDYLSLVHRDTPAKGCPVAALSSEIGHADRATKRAFTEALARFVDFVADALPERAASRDDVLSAASTLVGAVVLARATDDGALSADLLRAAKKRLARRARRLRDSGA